LKPTPTNGKRDTPKPEFISPQLAAAMSHPTRVRAMCVLSERTASPRQIAQEIDEPLNNVTYHLGQLRDLGCIELVSTEPAAGGRVLERFYRAIQRPYFDEEAWAALTELERLGVTSAIVKMISKDISVSMASGIFFSEDGVHASRSVLTVDDEGWTEISELLERNAAEIFEIEERVAERTAAGGGALINAKLEMMQFRSPPGA
jgi:DNA-binding transcriptional ArsR family regulator